MSKSHTGTPNAQYDETAETWGESFQMPVTTTETLPGREATEVVGIARGNTVEARNVGNDIVQGIRNLFGGELRGYSDLLSRAREEALSRMVADAEHLGADAVVNVRFETSEIANGGAEVIAYGTAVELKRST